MPHALRPRQKAAHTSAQSSQHTQPAVPGPSRSKPDKPISATAGLMADGQRAMSQAWLLKPTSVSRATHRAFIAENQDDQFLSLARALRDRGEEMQESMLTKFYLFLRDTLPEGLTGDLAHIRGDGVMRCLLNSTELVPSRHKFTRQAEAAFTKLDAWMSKSSNWRDAKAKHARESSQGSTEKPGRKKSKALAPGLYSPEGMLAILIIGHPDDDKFKNWIVRRLQIHWMLYDRDTLDVKEGFWKGLDASNLADIFTPEDERTADTNLLVDYTQLFGASFVRAQDDIQPYLQAWAKKVVGSSNDTSHDPSDSDALSDLEVSEPPTRQSSAAATAPEPASSTPAKVPVFPVRDTVKLRRALFPRHTAAPAELQQWLGSKLAPKVHGDPLVRWFRHWESQLGRSRSYYEQCIVQSLFLQSACRLYNLRSTSLASVESVAATQQPDSSPVPLEDLYVVLDMHDGKPKAPVDDLMTETVAFLRTHPVYKALEAANARLLQEAESEDAVDSKAVTDLLQKVFRQQTSSLRYISSSTHYSDAFYGAMAMDVVRTQVLLFSAEEAVPDDPLFWRDHKSLLTKPEVISTLKLTNWQLRALFMPGPDYQQVLTPAQDSVFRKLCTGAQGAETAKLDELPPMPITHGISSDTDLSIEYKDMLVTLFGDIEKPQTALPTPTSLAAVPCTEEQPQPTPSSHSTHEKAPAQSKTTYTPSAKPSLADTSPAPTCVSTPARNTSVPPITPNAYAGKVYLPAKRPASPADVNPKQTKILRPGIRGDLDSMRQELSDEVQASKNELRTEVQRLSEGLRQDVQASAEHLKIDLRQDNESSAEQLKMDFRQDVQASAEKLKVDLHQEAQSVTEQLKVDLRQEAQAATETLRSELQATKQELESQLRILQTGFTTDAGRLQQSLDAISAEVRGVTETLGKPPQPAGLLVQDCPAPAGQDQKDYESRLFRACFTYVYSLWDPEVEGGVGEDSGTLEDVKTKFPDLEETAIITALERFHALVFNQPVKRG